MCFSSWQVLIITPCYIWCTTRKLLRSLSYTYKNDLGKISKICEIILFVENTNMFVSAGTQVLALTTAQEILNTILNCMNCNKLHVN